MNRRVVITGLGLVSPLGLNVGQNWSNLLAGKSGISKLDNSEYTNLPTQIAGQINASELFEQLKASKVISGWELDARSRANIFALAAADEAIKDCGWQAQTEYEQARTGTSIATGLAGMSEISETAIALNSSPKGYRTINPYFIAKILPNLSSGLISIKYNLKGPNHCVSTACAAGSHSILDCYRFIKNNVADVMVCGATEASIHPVSIGGFNRMRALATKFNENPHEASRPFDAKRSGFVMSEGAGCLILESLEHALERKAKIYGEVLGGAMNADASHITAPSGDGAIKCIQLALQDSNLNPADVDYINCHATSTPVGDLNEVRAINSIFNQSNGQTKTLFSSFKGQLGHLLGACGTVESILTMMAINERIVPASANLYQPDPEMNLATNDCVKLVQEREAIVPKKGNRVVALKNSFGFGGTNVSLCFSTFSN